MRRRPLSRRTILRGGAGTAIALPLLAAMEPIAPGPARRAFAAGTKRFFAYCQPLSTVAEAFWPTAPGAAPYRAVTSLSREFRTGTGALDNPGFEPSLILEPLAAHKKDLLVVEGLDNCIGNHPAYSSTLAGAPTANDTGADGPSIDQAMAKVHGKNTKIPSLHLGVGVWGVGNKESVSWYAAGQAVPTESNPLNAFNRLFGDLQTDPAKVEALLSRRKSILDAAIGQATALRAGLPPDDVRKVDNYLDSIRDVERRIALATPSGCMKPAAPGAAIRDGAGRNQEELAQRPAMARAQLEILAMAFACDLTRVGTFQMDNEANNAPHPWLGISGRWHDLSHVQEGGDGWPGRAQDLVSIARWNMEQLAFFVGRLKALGVWEGTVGLWFVPMNNGQRHSSRNIPLLLLGSAGGHLRPGRHVRLPAPARDGNGRRINDLLLTLLGAMDVPATTWGTPALCTGPIKELLA